MLTTITAADPLVTLVPRKAMLGSSSGFLPGWVQTPALFSIGSASPVSADCATKRSLAKINLTSAGTMSPAARRTTSPGTNSRDRYFQRLCAAVFEPKNGAGDADHLL